MIDDMNQALANLTPEQRQLVELMLRQSEEQASTSQNTISQPPTVGAAPLSFAQQRLWFLDQLAPGSPVYNLPLAMRVDGKLDVNALTQSLNEVVARHEVLRTTFATEEGEPTQVIAPSLSISLPLIELSTLSKVEQATHLQQLVLEEAGQSFNLERGPLMRASLLRLSTSEHVLLLTMHHSVSDGWSISVLMREMAVLYHAFSAGQPSPLPNLPMQYKDYAIWQRKWLTGEVLEQQLGYWKRQLSGDVPALDLPTDHPRPLIQTSQGTIAKFQIPRGLTDRLKALGQQHSATLFMVLLAAFQTLLHRYTGQSDFVVGTPIANRNRVETESLIGFFVNTLALRVDLSGNPAFVELLQRVRQVTLGAYAHQDLPFERLVDELQLKRDMSRTPLFQVMLVLQNMPIPTIEAAGLKLTPFDLANSGTAKFDLTMTLTETADGLRGALEYSTDLFEVATIERLLEHYQILLAGIIVNPQQPLSELPLLTGEERHQLLVEWNATQTAYPAEKSIHELFEAQVEKTPEAVAIVFEQQQLTYAQLNVKANQLAHHLRSLGVGPDVLVGIFMQRSIEMVVALLGVLKAGGAYIPLDPTYPKERLEFILADSQVSVLLTETHLQNDLPEHKARVICLDQFGQTLSAEKTTNLPHDGSPKQLAYIIYTSGSTGRPKGVQVLQSGLTNFLSAMQYELKLTAADRLLSVTTISFDIAGLELYLPLIVGAQVEVLPREVAADGSQLRQRLHTSGTTILQATPATWHLLLEAGWSETERIKILCGGEALTTALAEALLPRSTSLWNMYGPTETTIWSTLAQIQKVDGIAPIGRPIANTQVYVLDGNFNPAPIGVPGELYIGGDGLARGYLNRPALTAERFIPDAFSQKPGVQLYRTGDLVRWLPSGNLEYLGRIDFQVKIRGHRIELGEIENVLTQHPNVREAVVVAREDQPSDSPVGTGKRIVAYAVSHTDQTLTAEMLREFLRVKLPEYMLPSAYVFLENLPLTPNGKIDRKALPKPEPVAGLVNTYVAPRSELEQIISQIWADVLQVEKVGIHDNFFDLGGHSLLMARVHHRLQAQLQRDVKLVTLFQYPSINTLARHLSVIETEQPAALLGLARAQLRRDLMKQPDDAVAVIGLAGRFPGAQNTEAFWQNLCAGKESITFFSDDELRAAGVDNQLLSNPNYVKAGSVLENIEAFDASFFGYNPREAAIMDPQQRFFLETAWEALEQAGYDSERYAGRIGVYASVSINTYLFNNLLSNPGLLESVGNYQIMLSSDKDFLTTRVSYKLNLKGPSINVQTACSSSMVAIHLACQGLLRGESDMALAGGVSIKLPQKVGYLYQEGGIVSPDGHCRAFDAQAKGMFGGNGVGVIVLKRLSDALTDGDTICAVIKGTAINNDGALKVGYTAPSVEGQAQVIAEAHSMAGVEPETISYVEAHGTGTELGDPIEIAALTQAFGRTGVAQPTGVCAIGSVKTNIGHLDAAAGVTGLIKTVLALQHKAIPPSLNFESPNPKLDLEHSPFYVNTAFAEWPLGATPRRAGVSSFGIGGTNAHAVLEEAPPFENGEDKRGWQLLLLSAKTDTALETATSNLAQHLKTHPEQSLADVAYTLQVGRRIFGQRRAVVCSNVMDAIAALESLDPKWVATASQEQKEQGVAFMFTGQGAQYVDMGRELYALEPVFREQVDRCCELLHLPLGLDLRLILYPADGRQPEAAEQLGQTWLTQPALFVVEYALAQLWISWGVKPQAMIGHSIGEYVAACLAGVFSLEDALVLVATRGRLMQSLPEGAMLAVLLTEPEVQPLLGKALSLAAVNGPALCVVSGTVEAVTALEQQLTEKGVEFKRLHTSHAFHSAMMDPILDLFAAEVKRVKLTSPQIPFISNLSGDWITAAEATDPAYWVRHLRSTVRFADGLGQLLKEPAPLLLEIGPGRTLSTLALKHPGRTTEQTVLSSMRHPHDSQSDQAFLLATLGKLWLAGVAVDWTAFHKDERRYRVPLPTYPFERQRCWVEPQSAGILGKSSAARTTEMVDWFYVPLWKCSALIAAEDDKSLLSPCLVFADQCGLGSQLAESLVKGGRQVIIVQAGESFAKLNDQLYTLNPGKADDYVALLNDLLAGGKSPQVIIHLWNVSQDSYTGLELKETEMAQETGFYSLLFLAQSLAQQDTSVRLMVVSNGLQKVTGDEKISLGKTTLLGPVRTISTEYAHVRCCSIDIDLAQSQPDIIDLLMAEVVSAFSDMIVAYRDSCRWVQTFEPIRLSNSTQIAPRLKVGGVYLITGGLGGIGFVLARYMAQAVQAKLVLVGRSAFPPVEEWDQWLAKHDEDDVTSRRIHQIRELEILGAEVMVCAADVANVEQMQGVISQVLQRFGRLNGVIHSAGVPGGGIIQMKTRAMAEHVFAPKIKGTLVLAKVLKEHKLDFLVLCSSINSVMSTLGQVDYCAANAFMDAFAHSRYLPSTPVFSINWNTWSEVGMAVEARKQRLGMQFFQDDPAKELSSTEGVEVFNRILAHRLPQVFISKGDLAAIVAQSQAWNIGLISATTNWAISPATLHPRPQLTNLYVAPESKIEQTLASIWQELLGIEQIGIHDNFFSIGGDSLLSIRLLARMKEQAGLHITPLQFMQHPTIAEQAKFVGINSPAPAVEQDVVMGQVPLTPPQDWFFRAITVQPERWATNICVEVYMPLNAESLRETLRHLLIHHDALRARFVFNGQEWQQFITSPDEISPFLTVRDLSAFPPERQQELIVETAYELQNSHALGVAPLVQVAYLDLGTLAPARLLISCHHLVIDGFSMGIIIEDFQRVYAQLASGQVVSLPLKTSSFKTYAEQLTQRTRAVAQREIDYWLNRPWERVKPLPMDMPEGRVDDTFGRVESVPLELGLVETDSLFRSLKVADGAQLKDFLLMALTLAFKQWKDLDVLFVKFEHLGRNAVLDELDLSRTVGWMATVSNMLLEVGDSIDPVKALVEMVQQARGLPMDGLGLGLLEYLAGDPEYAALAQPVFSLPQPHVFFNYLSRSSVPEQSVFGPAVEIRRESNDQRNNPLEVVGNLGENGLVFKFVYGPSVYRRETIETLAALYKENLLALGKTAKDEPSTSSS